MSLAPKVKAAINHVASVLVEADITEFNVSVSEGNIAFSTSEHKEEWKAPLHDPIGAAMENVLQEICTDCLKLDYYFADPFFVSLVKSYLEVLISQYGPEVPITKTMATVCLKYCLTEHMICYRGVYGALYEVDNAEHSAFESEVTQWVLKVH